MEMREAEEAAKIEQGLLEEVERLAERAKATGREQLWRLLRMVIACELVGLEDAAVKALEPVVAEAWKLGKEIVGADWQEFEEIEGTAH
jgi:hypothetical protein